MCVLCVFFGQVGTRVCVEKGHHATVASVKRSARGSNFVDPYTEEEVDARYRLMLKPGEVRELCTKRSICPLHTHTSLQIHAALAAGPYRSRIGMYIAAFPHAMICMYVVVDHEHGRAADVTPHA